MKPAKASPTIQDVAKAAGVSVSTVSRVLNDKDDVAPETYSRVQQVITDLGYASSLAARSMRSRKTNVIGVITFDVSDPYSILLLKGVDRAVRESSYDLIIYTSGDSLVKPDSGWERDHVVRLNGSLTDGIIVVTPTTTNLSSVFPLVTVDPHTQDNFPSVISTNRDGAMSVMEYLIGLGHRRIGFIGGRQDLQSASRRQQGYEDGLRQAKIPIIPELIQIGDFTYDTAKECAKVLLNLPDRPTAIFAANDQSALGAIEVAREKGLRVPEDLSVVGFDNIPETTYSNPPLTTVDQFIDEMGYIATKTLIELINGKPPEQSVQKVSTQLVKRDSCRAI